MLFENNNSKPRKRSYYPFSKNYPSKSGNIYAIGESRTKIIKEKRNRVIFYCSLVVLFAVVFVVLSVAISLSRKPLTDVNSTRASEYEGKLKAFYMPEDALSGGIAYSLFKTQLINGKANAVVVDFKGADGELKYKSGVGKAVEIGADSDASQNAISVISQLKKDGYRIIARIYCFEDTLAASMMLNAAVTEADGSVWLDKSAQDDGNPWLNPYSEEAQNYLLEIISESVNLGADTVLLCSVCFPDSQRSAQAVFEGEDQSIESRNAVLHGFVTKASQLCGNVPVAVYLDADSALNGDSALYGGGMFDSDAVFNAVDMRPEALPENASIDGVSLDDKDITENDIIQKYVPPLNEKLEDNYTTKGIIPVIDDEIYIATLENMGIDNYIIVKQSS